MAVWNTQSILKEGNIATENVYASLADFESQTNPVNQSTAFLFEADEAPIEKVKLLKLYCSLVELSEEIQDLANGITFYKIIHLN